MTNSFEAGLELRFLNSRIGLDFTYYSQISRNQIMSMASSDTSGYPYRLINAGEIENRGIEIALNTRPVQVGDFSWDLNLNFSKNNNKVLSLVEGTDMFELERPPGWMCRLPPRWVRTTVRCWAPTSCATRTATC